jgi:hypothetical protein
MFLNLTLAFGNTSPIIASGILNLALAYLPCSRALHVKCRLLPKDLITLPNIRTNSLTFLCWPLALTTNRSGGTDTLNLSIVALYAYLSSP